MTRTEDEVNATNPSIPAQHASVTASSSADPRPYDTQQAVSKLSTVLRDIHEQYSCDVFVELFKRLQDGAASSSLLSAPGCRDCEVAVLRNALTSARNDVQETQQTLSSVTQLLADAHQRCQSEASQLQAAADVVQITTYQLQTLDSTLSTKVNAFRSNLNSLTSLLHNTTSRLSHTTGRLVTKADLLDGVDERMPGAATELQQYTATVISSLQQLKQTIAKTIASAKPQTSPPDKPSKKEQQQLTAAKEELVSTKAELDSTKKQLAAAQQQLQQLSCGDAWYDEDLQAWAYLWKISDWDAIAELDYAEQSPQFVIGGCTWCLEAWEDEDEDGDAESAGLQLRLLSLPQGVGTVTAWFKLQVVNRKGVAIYSKGPFSHRFEEDEAWGSDVFIRYSTRDDLIGETAKFQVVVTGIKLSD